MICKKSLCGFMIGYMWFGLPKTYRVTRGADIARLFEHGKRAYDGKIALYAIPNDLDITRCGVAVGKRHGAAPLRNRRKRLCREAYRLIRHELPAGWDFVIMPKVGRDLELEELKKSILSLSGRLTRAGGQ